MTRLAESRTAARSAHLPATAHVWEPAPWRRFVETLFATDWASST
jgi:hypothetical protein